jgi:hypothetical protein
VIFGWKTPRDKALQVWQRFHHLQLEFYQAHLDHASQKIKFLTFSPE